MSNTSLRAERLRILLACARPMAARILKLRVKFRATNGLPDNNAIAAVAALLRDKLKLAILGGEVESECSTFRLSSPLPDLAYLESEFSKSDGVLEVSHETGGMEVDVHRPGEELQAALQGLKTLSRAVEVDVVDHAKPQDLREHLDTTPGYDAL